jgi:hypothetical protein
MSVVNVNAHKQVAALRILVVAHASPAVARLCTEIERRGASSLVQDDIKEAYALAQKAPFHIILVLAREGVAETLLLLQLLKAHAQGKPRVILLVHPDHTYSYALAASPADSMLSSLMVPERILDASGLPAVHKREPLPLYNPAPSFPRNTMRILILPPPLSLEALPPHVVNLGEEGGIPDAIILTRKDALRHLPSSLSTAAISLLPVLDFSDYMDTDATTSEPCERLPYGLSEALKELEPLVARLRKVPKYLFETLNGDEASTSEALLLARLAVWNEKAIALRDPNIPTLYRYAQNIASHSFAPQCDTTSYVCFVKTAERLVERGLLTKTLRDKLNCCPSCASSRINVREECDACHSINIHDVPIVHHFECGYQGPLTDFMVHSGLVSPSSTSVRSPLSCPKCTSSLAHFGVDYDQPGHLITCHDCGHQTGEAGVGFVCLDCEKHTTPQQIKTHGVYDYELTEAGRATAFEVSPVRNPLPSVSSTYGDIQSLHRQLSLFTKGIAEPQAPSAVLMVRLDITNTAKKEAGELLWRESVALFGRLLREHFTTKIDIIERENVFLVLVDRYNRDEIEADLPRLRTQLEAKLRIDMKTHYAVFGPDETGQIT